jgi:hypothetical protein
MQLGDSGDLGSVMGVENVGEDGLEEVSDENVPRGCESNKNVKPTA